MSLHDISNTALVIALILYTLAFFGFVISIVGKKWSNRDPELHLKKWRTVSFIITALGLASQLTFFFTRWAYAGHIPTSNMFEFLTFLAMMTMFAFMIIFAIYRSAVLGVFALPVAVVILAYASVFPWEVQPLIPALNSYWLKIHVTTAATGEAFFAVGFAAGLMYLLRTMDYKSTAKKAVRAQRGIELILLTVLVFIGFVAAVFSFNGAGYQAEFTKDEIIINQETEEEEIITKVIKYTLPPIIKPYDSQLVHMDSFLGMDEPLIEAASWMKGINAGRKANTVLWSLISGLILYGALRLIVRKKLGSAIQPILKDIDPEDLDEISYRAIAIGFPIFTLGALIFAMIWAHIAWSRFWGWDPKEVWALITWLFYSVYLHLRLSRGWLGYKSAWLSVIGFLIVMFTLIGVNLIIAGLHSYSGV